MFHSGCTLSRPGFSSCRFSTVVTHGILVTISEVRIAQSVRYANLLSLLYGCVTLVKVNFPHSKKLYGWNTLLKCYSLFPNDGQEQDQQNYCRMMFVRLTISPIVIHVSHNDCSCTSYLVKNSFLDRHSVDH